ESVFQRADCPGHETLRVPRLRRVKRFQFAADDWEQGDRRHAELETAFRIAKQAIDTLACDSRQERHLILAPIAFLNKDRIDQVLDGKAALAHQPPRE